MKAIGYLSKNARPDSGPGSTLGDFMREYKALDDSDKATLKAWTEQECNVLGITLESESE